MSWIKDVAHELKELDLSAKSLSRFGMTIGGIFLILSLWFFYSGIFEFLRAFLLGVGFILVLGAYLFPTKLSASYKIWMGFAFALGWIVSRFILSVLFYLVLTPVGLLARLFGKKFLETNYDRFADSYWIKKEEKKIDYEKMF